MSHFISKSGAGKAATLCVMLLLAGCSTYFSKPALYVPPANSPDIAKIRLMGAPMSLSLIHISEPTRH